MEAMDWTGCTFLYNPKALTYLKTFMQKYAYISFVDFYENA